MKKKRILFLAIFILAIVFLTGCSSFENEGGFFHDYLVVPLRAILLALANFFKGNYGIAIIVLTILMRGVLLPFSLNAAKKQQVMREKMEVMKPELDDIQARLKQAKTKEEQQKIQQEMILLYQKHDFNPFAMGCLPLLLQMPVWMGIFYAIRTTPEIANSTFLWFNLGRPDWILAILAALSYYLQFKVSTAMTVTAATTPEQQQQMKMMGIMSPVMILIASFSTVSALSLYWCVSGFFLIGQTYLTRKLYGPNADEEMSGKTTATSNPPAKQGNKTRKKKKKKR